MRINQFICLLENFKLKVLAEKLGKSEEETREILNGFDPTRNWEYGNWIVRQIKTGDIVPEEDYESVKDTLIQFHRIKKIPTFEGNRNIMDYHQVAELHRVIEASAGLKSKKQTVKDRTRQGVKSKEYGDFKVWEITTVEAATALTKGCKWCTKDPKWSTQYLANAPLIMVSKGKDRLALVGIKVGAQLSVLDERNGQLPPDLHKDVLVAVAETFPSYLNYDYNFSFVEAIQEKKGGRLADYSPIINNLENDIINPLLVSRSLLSHSYTPHTIDKLWQYIITGRIDISNLSDRNWEIFRSKIIKEDQSRPVYLSLSVRLLKNEHIADEEFERLFRSPSGKSFLKKDWSAPAEKDLIMAGLKPHVLKYLQRNADQLTLHDTGSFHIKLYNLLSPVVAEQVRWWRHLQNLKVELPSQVNLLQNWQARDNHLFPKDLSLAKLLPYRDKLRDYTFFNNRLGFPCFFWIHKDLPDGWKTLHGKRTYDNIFSYAQQNSESIGVASPDSYPIFVIDPELVDKYQSVLLKRQQRRVSGKRKKHHQTDSLKELLGVPLDSPIKMMGSPTKNIKYKGENFKKPLSKWFLERGDEVFYHLKISKEWMDLRINQEKNHILHNEYQKIHPTSRFYASWNAGTYVNSPDPTKRAQAAEHLAAQGKATRLANAAMVKEEPKLRAKYAKFPEWWVELNNRLVPITQDNKDRINSVLAAIRELRSLDESTLLFMEAIGFRNIFQRGRGKLLRDVWLVHRTTHVEDIKKSGFNPEKVGFAVEAENVMSDIPYRTVGGLENQFGDAGVVFKAKYANRLEDGQVLFLPQHMYNIHYITYDWLDEQYSTDHNKTRYKSDDFADCVAWIMRIA